MNSLSNERKVIDKIYEKVIDCETKPYIWAYGRFKLNNQAKVNDILFASMQSYQLLNLNSALSIYFGVDTSKMVGNNEHTDDNILNDYDMPKQIPYAHEGALDDEEVNEEEAFENDIEEIDEAQHEARIDVGNAYWDIPRFEYNQAANNIFELR